MIAPPAICQSADLRYPFMKGGPNSFGVFKLSVEGGTCSTAHRVAKVWMRSFEADLKKGRVKIPRRVSGFSFTVLKPTEAQEYRLRGKRAATTIRFVYRVPNG